MKERRQDDLGAIVNAANRKLLGGEGSASGPASFVQRLIADPFRPSRRSYPSWCRSRSCCCVRQVPRQGRSWSALATYDVRIEAGASRLLSSLAIASDQPILPGECVVTDAFALPAQKIFHVVGPDTVRPLRMGNLAATPQEMEQQLRSCYEYCKCLVIRAWLPLDPLGEMHVRRHCVRFLSKCESLSCSLTARYS